MSPEHIHDIARIAAITAQSIVTTSDFRGAARLNSTAAAAAIEVVDAYIAAVTKLGAKPSKPDDGQTLVSTQ